MTSFNSNNLTSSTTMLKQHIQKTITLMFSFSSLFMVSYNAFSQATLNPSQDALSYHSVIPETFHGGFSAADNANIMLILDSSGSMALTDPENTDCSLTLNDDASCAARDDSRSSRVREGIRNVLNDPEVQDTVNFGLMSFKLSAHQKDLSFENQDLNSRQNGAILRAPIRPLSNTQHLDDLLELLGQENNTHFRFQQNFIGLDDNGAINSWGGTPIEGSLLAGLRYFTNDSVPNPKKDLLGNPNRSPGNNNVSTRIRRYDSQGPNNNRTMVRDGQANTAIFPLNEPERLECPAETAIILLTDGLPSQLIETSFEHPQTTIFNDDGTSEIIGGVDCTDSHLDCSIQIAKISRNLGVPVYVIGFSDGGLADQLNSLAQAGSGRDAFDAGTPEEVSEAIKTVLQNLNTASASASNASVTTAGLTSRGSIVQARFTPFIAKDLDDSELIDRPNEKVSWSGEVVSYFIDEQGIFREDTNQDGVLNDGTYPNGKLPDRPFIFWFDDSAGEKVTKVRYLERDGTSEVASSPSGLNPEGHIDINDVVALEDVKPIWSAADWLNKEIVQPTTDLSDTANSHVIAQRPYGAKGSDSSNWRHILTWDGTFGGGGNPQLIDFTWAGDNIEDSDTAFDRQSAAHLGHYDLAHYAAPII